jgi:hypothetical protein
MARHTCFAFIGLAAVLSFAAVAPPRARADENAEARVYFEQGNRALAQGMSARGARRTRLLQEALDAYVQSLRIVRSRNVVYNAGIALEALERHAEAFTYFQEYLGYNDLTEDERREATEKLDALRQHVAVVAIESTPRGAEVRIDRRELAPVGVTPIEVAVTDGEHRVFLSLEGYEVAELTATGRTGERVAVTSELAPSPVSVVIRAPDNGTLTINGHLVRPGEEIRVIPGRHVIRYEPATVREIEILPGQERVEIDLSQPEEQRNPAVLAISVDVPSATVLVDGAVIEGGAEVETQVRAGTRMVRVTAPGYAPVEQAVRVDENGRAELSVHLEREVEGSSLGAWPAVAWIATGAVGVAGVALGINALLEKGDFDGNPRPTESDFDAVERANLAADIVGGAAIALGITALVLTLANGGGEQPPSTIQVAGAPLPGGGMLVARMPWGAE